MYMRVLKYILLMNNELHFRFTILLCNIFSYIVYIYLFVDYLSSIYVNT